ncbi:hypothetical protein MMC31_002859, partial [Peltigera leucophlebia]|nr:hypothetical protein [Peltigera leucophlebia]
MPGLEQGSHKEQENCFAQLEEDTEVETSAQYQHTTGNILSLVALMISGPKTDKYALEFTVSQWPQRTNLVIAELVAEQRRLELQVWYIYSQIDFITEAKEKMLAAEQLRI